MTTQEVPPLDEGVRVTRDGSAIRVTWRGDIPREELDAFTKILLDLVDGQGNLTVAVDFPDLAVVGLPLLERLLEVERRLATRSGRLSVSTRIGFWAPAISTVQRAH